MVRLVSAAADALINAWKRAFPDDPRGQCYPHVNLKFNDNKHKRQNGKPGYYSKVLRRSFLKRALEDVRALHSCKTAEMQKTMADLVIRAWKMPPPP